MFLGLDLGTSNVKVLVVDRGGAIVAEGSAPVTRLSTPDGAVSQNVDQIWDATCRAIRQAIASTEDAGIEAIGVSAQGGALQLLDAADCPLGPVVSWLDSRGGPFDRQIERQRGRQWLVDHTGCNFSATTFGQIARISQESPRQFAAAAGIGYVGDVIVGRLCGRRAHDATSLSLAMLYNPSLAAADPDVLQWLRIDEKRLPDLLPATEPAGTLQADAAQRTGLPQGIPISPAIHDQYAAALGAGVVARGDILVGTGTAWVLLAVADRLGPPAGPRTFVGAHPVPGLYGQLSSIPDAGAAIEQALDAAGWRGLDADSLDAATAAIPAGAEGFRFYPLLDGAKSAAPPDRTATTPLATGMLLANDPLRDPGRLLRAVFEGLACELAHRLHQLSTDAVSVERLVLAGPAAAGRVLPQIIADFIRRPVTCVNHVAVSARGAAVLARAMVEPGSKLSELSRRLVPESRTVIPGADAACYARQLREYAATVASANPQE